MTTDTRCFDATRLLDRPGPHVSAYLRTPSARADARQVADLAWRALRERLAAAGATPAQLTAADAAVAASGHAGGAALALFVDGRARAEAWGLSEPVASDRAWVAPLPRIGPLLEWQSTLVPHVVVVADRTGADLLSFPEHSEPEADATTVTGETLHIHRSHPGGWSQRRFQQRAENRWEQNAALVAVEVVRAVEAIAAELVVVAGDERAVGFLREHLPPVVAQLVVVIPGSRQGGYEALADEVMRQVATLVAGRTRDRLQRFAELRGRGDAVEGAAPTLRALGRGAVATLLAHDDPDDDREAYFDRDSVAAEPASLDDPVRGRLVDVALLGAHRTGADTHIVPAHGPSAPAGGLGAVLRYPST